MNHQRFTEARVRAYVLMPYLSHAIMSLVPVQKPGLGTLSVDKYGRCYYDEVWLDQQTVDQAAGLILHESLHLVLLTGPRCVRRLGERIDGQQQRLWNIAADLPINEMLRETERRLPSGKTIRVELPEGGCYPDKMGLPPKQTCEQYYDLLQQDPPDGDDGDGPPKPGGSSSDNQPRSWEDGPPEDGQTPPGLSPHEQEMIARQTAKQIEAHEEKYGRGSVPGGLRRMAQQILRPKVDPVKELLAKCKYAVACTSGFGDFSYKRPNRRTPPGCATLPAHIRPVPKVLVVVDTSGSMGEKDLALALGVIGQVIRGLPDPRGVRVIAGDTCVGSCKDVFRPEQVELVGDGGTDMGALIVEAAKERPRPTAILVATDGETDWPEQPVGPQVVACLTRPPNLSCPVPAWISTVVLNPEDDDE